MTRLSDLSPHRTGEPEEPARRFYGRYGAQVADNNDPGKQGKLKLIVPEVAGNDQIPRWAPMGGGLYSPGGGYGSLFLPEKNDWVWVEFEQGLPHYPVWTPGWWGSDELPDDLKTNYPARRGFVTKLGHELIFDDTESAQVIFKHAAGHDLVFDDSGSGLVTLKHKGGLSVTIDNEKVKLAGGGNAAPKFPTFESRLATALTQIIGVLQAGTQGTPAAQQLTGLSAVLSQLEQFVTDLGAGTFDSEDVENS